MLNEITKPHFLDQIDYKIAQTGAGEMDKWIRTLAALPEDQDTVPITHMVDQARL